MAIAGRPACSEQEFLRLWNAYGGSAARVAEELNVVVRNVYARAERLERAGKLRIRKSDGLKQVQPSIYVSAHKARVSCEIKNGVVMVGSDAHIWPGDKTTALRGFLKLVKELKPQQIHMNGDVFDGAKISRHPKIGFLEKAPDVRDEIKACQEALEDFEDAVPGCQLFWELGNHDLRFEAFLAAHAQQYEGLDGMHLKDRFPRWRPCWSVHINPNSDGHTVIKHRFKGGKYDVSNNVMNAHVNIVTGHTHSLKYWPMSTYKQHTIYGVNTGTLAEPYSEQFVNYTEDNPVDWRAGFAVLTFWKGILMPPELAQVIGEGKLVFRGKVIDV